eukprot:70281-Chlamydomonas_euryale.AAC.1
MDDGDLSAGLRSGAASSGAVGLDHPEVITASAQLLARWQRVIHGRAGAAAGRGQNARHGSGAQAEVDAEDVLAGWPTAEELEV